MNEKKINELLEFYEKNYPDEFSALIYALGPEEAERIILKANGRKIKIIYDATAYDKIDFVEIIDEMGQRKSIKI